MTSADFVLFRTTLARPTKFEIDSDRNLNRNILGFLIVSTLIRFQLDEVIDSRMQ